MNNKIKVLIGDDSAGTGVSLANKLRERGMYAYTRRKDQDVIIEAIRNDAPDVAVLDVNAGNGDAVTIMKKIKELGVKAPAYIITSELDNEFIERQVMDNGAAKFLLNAGMPQETIDALTARLCGN